ncbi:hypothetical protein CONCODRAFT_11488 [Conidiobolus coronatus NRRL 28638]|uniref:Uncharacterized protein n=1 Tax=Conidiobolus coronatus (strain ATCC 28846 / CBS 209.66 / NRRL 28638) TaxID=796925 RepID=A0A137NVF8_CONC2|nr:hypothetical protein CONCODRAFT_11488 [Conidiobolus coronatus NRRL 28638]|eukprot:KXN66631.1 hypothetical protein CONCODRAFT_11488 [Conidiobolus coronatus NRRL 28638]
MQFKLLAATLLASSVAAEYTNYMDCLVKKECKTEVACVNECFQTSNAKPDQLSIFTECNSGRCIGAGRITKDTKDFTKYYECLPKCYNHCIGDPNGTSVDLNAKASAKKDEERKEGEKKDEEKKDGEKKDGEKKDGEKKDGDKKDDATKTTTTITSKTEDKPTTTEEDKKTTSTDEPTTTEKSKDEKPKQTSSTTSKAPAPAPTSNAFKTVPSVFAAFVLAALAL